MLWSRGVVCSKRQCAMTFRVWYAMRFQDWRCRCTPFNDWARIVTQFFERGVIEHADQQCHEHRNGSKDRNYREKGTQHSGGSEDYTPHAVCKADGRAKVSLFDALIFVNSN